MFKKQTISWHPLLLSSFTWLAVAVVVSHGVYSAFIKVSKGAKIWNRYNQVPHLAQDTNGKMTTSQLDTTNEIQEVSPFLAGDNKFNDIAPIVFMVLN